MSFPLSFQGHTFATAPALAQAVTADAEAGGGSLFPGQCPPQWLLEMREQGLVETGLLVALAGHLLAARQPATAAVGARLTVVLDHPELVRMLSLALEGHDLGLLLQLDPLDPEHTIEDTLLDAAAATAGHAPDTAALLTRLRNAGLPHLELAVLCEHAAEEQVRAYLPAALRDHQGDPGALLDTLSTRMPELSEWIDALLA